MTMFKKEIGPFYFYKRWNTYMGGSDMVYGVEVKVFSHRVNFFYSRPLWRQ